MLANIYAAAGQYEAAAQAQTNLQHLKIPVRSFIEVNNRVHSFVVDDNSHPHISDIHLELHRLEQEMTLAGFVANTSSVLHGDVDEEHKQHMLCYHSKKLALGLGLISTPPGTPLVITKNVHVCPNCHNATKLISQLGRREIIRVVGNPSLLKFQ